MRAQRHTITATLAICSVLASGPVLAQAEETVAEAAEELDHDLDLDLDFGAGGSRTGLRNAADAHDPALDFSLDFGMLHDPDPPAPAGHGDLASAATNPVASLIQLQFQNTFVGESTIGDAPANTFVVQRWPCT